MDKNQTIQWVATAVVRLLAGYIAVKFGADAVSQPTWDNLAGGLAGAFVAGVSIFTSIKARKTLLAQTPPK